MEDKKVHISVAIPCRNEAPFIKECLDAIFNSHLEEGIQLSVFVVDGMSDDGTREVVEEYIKSNAAVYLIDNEKQLTPYAYNLGVKRVKSDFVQIIGARHIISSNYIQNAYKRLKESTTDWCVGGRLENVYLNETGEVIAKAMSTALGMGIGNFRTLEKPGYTDTVTSPMYPYHVFEEIGFFDEDLIRNQDDDFNFRVKKAGGKIFFDSTIYLKYYVRGNFKGLWRQFFQYGYWKVFVNKKHKAVTTFRQLIPPLFVLFTFLTPFLQLVPVIATLVQLIWLLYGGLVFLFSMLKASSVKQFFMLILTYFILHFAYGLGYLNGLFDFVLLKRSPSNKQIRLSR